MCKNRKTTEQFIKESHVVHGNLYDYSLVEYVRTISPVKIICIKHGVFEQQPCNHIKGCGCPKCAIENNLKKESYNTEYFITKAKEIHGDKYDYSLVDYINSSAKVKIICPIHGVFEQNYQKHCYAKRGCWECGKKSCADKNRFSQEHFIEKAKAVHGDKYDYSLVEYVNSQKKVKIKCFKHGIFEQMATSHLQGMLCEKCSVENRTGGTLIKKVVLQRFQERHGDLYTYNLEETMGSKDIITITCPLHGAFSQTVGRHFRSGCQKCGYISTGNYQRNKPKELDRVCRNLRRRLKKFMQKRGFKKSQRTCDVIGLNWDDFKMYLEDNPYGFKVDCIDLDTDHIIPISTGKSEEDMYKLTHYTNLQLLPKDYNQHIKRDNPFDREHFEKWLIETKYNKC